MIGWMGSIVEAKELSNKLAWLVRVVNGSSSPASFHSLEYHLIPRNGPGDPADPALISAFDEQPKAIDQAGDTHQRIVSFLRGTIRNPTGVTTPFDT
jgi:hypothetical protein